MGMFALFFLGVVGFSIYKSRRRVKTVLYTLSAMALLLVLAWGATVLLPSLNAETTGKVAIDLVVLVGMLTVLIHSRRSRI
jgi:hypothetical protein